MGFRNLQEKLEKHFFIKKRLIGRICFYLYYHLATVPATVTSTKNLLQYSLWNLPTEVNNHKQVISMIRLSAKVLSWILGSTPASRNKKATETSGSTSSTDSRYILVSLPWGWEWASPQISSAAVCSFFTTLLASCKKNPSNKLFFT